MLDLLLAELVFDVEAEGHRAFIFLAVFGVVAAKSNELLAHWASSVSLALTSLGVLHNSFHLLARWQRAVSIATLAGMDQGLDAALDAEAPGLLGALGLWLTLTAALIIKTQPPLYHLMGMALCVVAIDTKVVIL